MSEEPSSSQGSAMDERDLDQLQESVQVETTKQQTSWGVKTFREWCQKRRLNVQFDIVSSDELSTILRRFYGEVKTKKGMPMTPSSLTCLRTSLHRHLTQPPFNRRINIISDPEFLEANRTFEAKQKLYRQTGNAKPKHKPCIEEGNMRKLNVYFRANIHRPAVNQQFLWFSLCYYLGRRGREGWRALRLKSFEVLTDDEGKRYVTMSATEATKNHQAAKQDEADYSDDRMYEQEELCPVSAFENHLTHLNEKTDALFQQPSESESMKNPFTANPMGKNSLSQMMPNLSKAAGLSRVYTNHSVRVTTVTNLHRGGVTPSRICAVTKHKDEKSLAHYLEEPTVLQKCENIPLF